MDFEESQLQTRYTGSSKAAVTDDSVTVSDHVNVTTGTDAQPTSPPPLSSPDLTSFKEGEEVIVYHCSHPYAARIQRAEFNEKQWRYFVHYIGWKKSWDEWVGVDRLQKWTEANIRKLEERGPQTKPPAALLSTLGVVAGTSSKKRKRYDAQKDKGGLPSENFVFNLHIPHPLKKQLIDDCEFITHLGKLLQLPRSPSVDEILGQYSAYRQKKDGMVADSLREILSGLQRYFDKALSALLLYKNERDQYEVAIKDGVCPSFVYGAEHLLRLFVKLPEILHHANIEDESVIELQQELQDFLRFLHKNQSSFFASFYIN